MASFCEDDRALQAGRPGTDDQHALPRSPCPAEPLRVPAAPVFFTRCGVLRAADMAAVLGAGVADVAADAFPDLFIPPLLDLLREQGVRDRRAGGSDAVQLAPPDKLCHRVGGGERPDPE